MPLQTPANGLVFIKDQILIGKFEDGVFSFFDDISKSDEDYYSNGEKTETFIITIDEKSVYKKVVDSNGFTLGHIINNKFTSNLSTLKKDIFHYISPFLKDKDLVNLQLALANRIKKLTNLIKIELYNRKLAIQCIFYLIGKGHFTYNPKTLIAEKIIQLFKNNIDVHCQGYHYTTLLHNAARNAHFEAFKLMLEMGADINQKDKHGYTPLHHAAKGGCLKIVQLLIQKETTVNKANWWKMKGLPLYLAAKKGHFAVVHYFIKIGVDVSDARFQLLHTARCIVIGDVKETRFQPLHTAAARGHSEIVRLLIEEGRADVNQLRKDISGRSYTALYYACLGPNERQLPVVKTLLDRGADPNKHYYPSESPLQAACRYGRHQTVQLLLNAGANLNGGIRHLTPLISACENGHEGIVELLLEKGADVHKKNLFDNNYQTALEIATANKHTRIIELLNRKITELQTKKNRLC